jgi:hypothetical protein
MKQLVIVTYFTMKIIRTYLYITCNKKILFVKNILAYCGHSTSLFFLSLSEHKHCDNAATSSNSENARSRMVASLRGSVGKGRWVKYWPRLGCWISPCFGPFSLGARCETYEPFISLIFQFFFGAAVNRGYWIHGYGVRLYIEICTYKCAT